MNDKINRFRIFRLFRWFRKTLWNDENGTWHSGITEPAGTPNRFSGEAHTVLLYAVLLYTIIQIIFHYIIFNILYYPHNIFYVIHYYFQ